MINYCRFLILSLFVYISISANAQFINSGPQIFTYHSDVDDTEQYYACYVPPKYNAQKKYPMVVMLHGAGSNSKLALRRVFGKSNKATENDVEASLYFPKWNDVEYIVVAPNARGTMGYQGVAEKDVMDVLADAKSKFNIDENRTYLTGLSMGGGGTVWLGLTHPDIWAAIAPVCPAPPFEYEKYLPNANMLEAHFFQGGSDPVVKPIYTQKLVADFKAAGANVFYDEYPGVLHDSWVKAYENGRIFDWFKKYERNPYPNSIKFTTEKLKYGKVFWLTILENDSSGTSVVEAVFKAKNQLYLTTQNISKIKLDIGSHPNYNPKMPATLIIDGQTLSISGLTNEQILLKENGNWKLAKLENENLVKNNLLEGPMLEAFADRQIYVYGTADKPIKDVLEIRINQANEAANWSYYRGDFMGRVLVYPRVLADKDLRPSDIERSNLILFGNKSTNSYIAKLSLPFEINDKAGDSTNLTMILPNKNHYVLINSGLPFWVLPKINQGVFGGLANPAKGAILRGYGDFVLFDKKVILNSYFDKNWKLKAIDKDILEKSGIIDIK